MDEYRTYLEKQTVSINCDTVINVICHHSDVAISALLLAPTPNTCSGLFASWQLLIEPASPQCQSVSESAMLFLL